MCWVVVDFVCGYNNNSSYRCHIAQRFKQVGSPHDVGGKGLQWITVGGAHQGLGSQVEDDLRLRFGYNGRKGRCVADVAVVVDELLIC